MTGRLQEAFGEHVATLAPEVESGDAIVVACSGGLDSMVLLHLLHFGTISARTTGPTLSPRVVVAHLDHAMRSESAADARWLAGVCRAWGLELYSERCGVPPVSEDEARTARYAFFDDVRRSSGVSLVATAHHADDQAETVLFRAVRGSGIDGLAGILPRRADGVIRPLLPWTREELAAYARRVGLSWRDDTTNADLSFARNALRRRIIPDIEATVAPGARVALARLAAAAATDRDAWGEVLPILLERLDSERSATSVSVDLESLTGMGRSLRMRLLRALASEVGASLDYDATARAAAFVKSGRSGSGIDLGRGAVLSRELGRLVLTGPGPGSGLESEAVAASPDRTLEIPSPVRGSGEALLGGRAVHVEWAAHTAALVGGPVSSLEQARFSLSELDFPLRIRGRAEGDRIGLAGGTRPLKKVLLEARVPSSGRDSVPLLVDASDRILWVPGIARSRDVSSTGRALTVRIG